MLVYLGICAVLAFLAAVAVAFLVALPAPLASFARVCLTDAVVNAPASALHIAFAAGAMPLVFGAIVHFVPVLTRSAVPERAIQVLPLLVQAAGIATPLALGGGVPYESLHVAAAVVALVALGMTAWLTRRLRRTLGAPHPGARWYGAALLCLFLAVSLVPVWLLYPDLRAPLRLFHLHLNTLGFLGLAALGTLPVLLPTALGRPEPGAGSRLRSDLLMAAVGVLLVGVGATGLPGAFWFGAAGALALLRVIVRDWLAWRAAYGWETCFSDGAAAPLVAATFGLAVMIVVGVVHGAGGMPARPAIAGFAVGFLLPLVTGALSQLLPVWSHPGRDSLPRRRMRAMLAWGGEWRALLFLFGGATLAAGSVLGVWPLLLGLLWFFALLAAAFVLDSPPTTDDNPAPDAASPTSAPRA